MRPTLGVLAIVLLMVFSVGAAQGASFAVSSTQSQIEDGQIINFVFGGVPLWTSYGTLEIVARGDYSTDNPNEVIDWNIDGIASGTAGPTAGGAVMTAFGGDDVEWRQLFIDGVSPAEMSAITVDGTLTITLDLAGTTLTADHLTVEVDRSDDPYVQASLTFVPEPSTYALIGLGLLGIGILRRRQS